jgi:hypothetical protein
MAELLGKCEGGSAYIYRLLFRIVTAISSFVLFRIITALLSFMNTAHKFNFYFIFLTYHNFLTST